MPSPFRELVGRRIREERESAGYMNQRRFAELVGLDPSQLCRIELGQRNVDSVLLRRIADALEVSMDDFFEERRQELALARQGDADDESTQEMIAWTLGLRRDIDLLFDYVGGRTR
ncbi:MAG: helix-turn-helix domain-containing protein [Gaiellaceae bacterium]